MDFSVVGRIVSSDFGMRTFTYGPIRNIDSVSKSKIIECAIPHCEMCESGLNSFVLSSVGWKWRLVTVFDVLEKSSNSSRNWFSLSRDIFPFIDSHWRVLWNGSSEKHHGWKKKVLDCLSHNKSLFVSGSNTMGRRGVWKFIRDTERLGTAKTRSSFNSCLKHDVPDVPYYSSSPSSKSPSPSSSPIIPSSPTSSPAPIPEMEVIQLPSIIFASDKLENPLMSVVNAVIFKESLAPCMESVTPRAATASVGRGADRCLSKDFNSFLARHGITR